MTSFLTSLSVVVIIIDRVLLLFRKVFTMNNLSNEDIVRIHRLHEQGFVATAITASYPDKTGA